MDFDAIIVGSGFGGTVAATRLAAKGKKVLILERGTWWITPETLGKPPAPPPGKLPMRKWLEEKPDERPTQFWPRPDHKEGLLDLSVIEYDPDRADKSAAAKNHTFCERQGRCILGCLPAARHTLNKALYMRVLSDPNSGVALSPLSEVEHLRPTAGGWELEYRDHRSGDEHKVTAPVVFLAAGTLGTTKLLLRAQRDGLALSDRVGHGFSTNGDFGAFALNTAKTVQSTRGPVNTCHVAAQIDGTRITVEDCAIPSMFAAIASAGLNVLDNVVKRSLFHTKLRLAWLGHAVPDLREFLPHLPDTFDPSDARTEAETVANIFFFNVMGQDDASGRFTIDDDGDLELKWDQAIAKHPTLQKSDQLCRELTAAMGADARYVALWDALPHRRLTIPHPLGGCPVGPNRHDGAVDPLGRVFDGAGATGTEAHEGL